MELVVLQFLECLPPAFAVGLLLLPRLLRDQELRLGWSVAGLAVFRAAIGFWAILAIAHSVIVDKESLSLGAVVTFAGGTIVGQAWILTEIVTIAFAVAAIQRARLRFLPFWLDQTCLVLALLVTAAVPLAGHALDDTLPLYARFSFLLHTAAGLLWFGGLLGLVSWMYAGRKASPERALFLAERWSLVAKIAMALVIVTGIVLTVENVGSVARLLATSYGRMLILKVVLLCAVLLIALKVVSYQTRVIRQDFDPRRWAVLAGVEAAFGGALVFAASWLGVITPALHDDDLVWPLPFRVSWDATWGLGVPAWSAPWLEAIAAALLVLAAAIVWSLPGARKFRLHILPPALVAAVVLAFVSLSVQAYPETFRISTVPYSVASIARGYDLFQANCSACHGEGGDGDGPAAKGLPVQPANLTAPHVATHTLGDIFHWLGQGVGPNSPMPVFSALTEDEKWDLINFLRILSTTYQSRLLTTESILQFMVAPDLSLRAPDGERTDIPKLRGAPVLLSVADCGASAQAPDGIIRADGIAEEKKIPHIIAAGPGCPTARKAFVPVHPAAVFRAMAIVNRDFNELFMNRVDEAHFLIDRSGFLRARFRHLADDESGRALRREIDKLAAEPLVDIPEGHFH